MVYSPMQHLLPRHATAKDLYADIRELTKAGGDYTVHNYMAVIEDLSSPEAALVETELFPRDALEFYTKWNMGHAVTDEDVAKYRTPERGGAQGDYRDGMPEKLANAIDCLKTHGNSKRATIPIPFATQGSKEVDWQDQGQTKCCRELYLFLEDGKLCCTAVLRMQNASIFPKNIHFFATALHHVAKRAGYDEPEKVRADLARKATKLAVDLLLLGCDPSATNHYGQTAMHIAMEHAKMDAPDDPHRELVGDARAQRKVLGGVFDAHGGALRATQASELDAVRAALSSSSASV